MSDFEVHIPDESSMHDFLVAFPGPEDSELLSTEYNRSIYIIIHRDVRIHAYNTPRPGVTTAVCID